MLEGLYLQQNVKNHTQDGFIKEEDAQKYIAQVMRNTGAFHVYEQVDGFPVFRHHLQEFKDVRCDLLLIPNTKYEKKISTGVIVIEVKKSGEKIGPAFSQLKDYLNSIFIIKEMCNVGFVPTYGFLFPCLAQHEATASWLSHQHLGTVSIKQQCQSVVFCSGEERLMQFSSDGKLEYFKESKCGRKTGSR